MKRMIPILMLAAILTAALALVPAQVAVAQDGHGRKTKAAWRAVNMLCAARPCMPNSARRATVPRARPLGDGPAFVAIEYDPDTARDHRRGLDTHRMTAR